MYVKPTISGFLNFRSELLKFPKMHVVLHCCDLVLKKRCPFLWETENTVLHTS